MLDQAPNTEWSGPAFYTILKYEKSGLPKQVELSYFIPLDLGSHAATEWDAKDCAKNLKAIYSKNPKLKKSVMGHIHSHHGMGAYFSGTDTDTMEENALPGGFFFSLVVAHTKTKYAFAMSYQDQYGEPRVIEADEDDIRTLAAKTVRVEWKNQWEYIKGRHNKAQASRVTYGRQTNLLNGYNSTRVKPAQEAELVSSLEDMTKKQKKQYEKLLDAFNHDKMEWMEFREECQKIGVRPAYYANGYHGYGGYTDGQW